MTISGGGIACIIAIYLLNKKGLCHLYTCDKQLLTYKKFFFQLEASAESLIELLGSRILTFRKQEVLRYSITV